MSIFTHVNQFEKPLAFNGRQVMWLNGLTGAPIHTGSWGLPDVGLTEAIGNIFGTSNNQQGGSNISGNSILSPVPAVNTSNQVKGGGGPSKVPQPQPGSRAVLGSATGPVNLTGGTGGNGGGPNPTNNAGPTGQSGPPNMDSQINDAYSGEMNFLHGLQPQLQSNLDSGTAAANQQYTGQQKTIADQLGQLNQQLGIDTTNWNQNMNSAYSQAQNTYNQLLNRNLAMYGGGSSAGPAIAAILGQGYQQQGGQLTNENLSGQQQLGLQQGSINQWGDTNNNQLDTWHNQALNQLQTTFQQGMDQVNQQIGATEDAKAQAKLGLLQNYINQQTALSNYKDQLSTYMQAYQSATPSQMGVTAFNPGNYSSVMGQLGGQAGVTQNSLQSQYGNPINQTQQIASGAGFFPMAGGNNNNNNNQLPPITGLPNA